MSRLDMDKMMEYTRSLIGIPDEIKENAAKMYSDAVNKNEDSIKNNIEAFKAFTDVNAVSVIRAILVGSKLVENEYSDIRDIAEYIQKLGINSAENTDIVTSLSKYTQNVEKESNLWGDEADSSTTEETSENWDESKNGIHIEFNFDEDDEDEECDEEDENSDELGNETEKQEEIEEKQQEDYKDSIEKGEFAGKAKKEQLEGPITDNPIVLSAVEKIIKNIFMVYDEVYSPLYLNAPAGVLCTSKRTGYETIINCGKANTHQGSLALQDFPSLGLDAGRLYRIILSTCKNYLREAKIDDPDSDGMEVDLNWMHADGAMKFNYIPYVQVRNCNGIYKDSKDGLFKRAKNYGDFKKHYEKALRNTIIKFLERVDLSDDRNLRRAQRSLVNLYTNIVCMNSFDPDKAVSMTLHLSEFQEAYQNKGLSNLVNTLIVENVFEMPSTLGYKVMQNETADDGTQRILLVTDLNRLRKEINFAYKTIGNIFRSGQQINLGNVVIGTSAVDGSPISMNLNNNSYVSFPIIAGSRSGKGVLTLALLSYMIATRSPFLYVDFKPDMAPALWKLEKSIREQYPNARIFAVDGAGGVPDTKYTVGWGAPKSVKSDLDTEVYNNLVYAKGLQISVAISAIRAKQSESGGIKLPCKNKMFYIFDEAEALGQEIKDKTIPSIEKALKKFKVGKDGTNKAESNYLNKLLTEFTSLNSAGTSFKNTYNGKGAGTAIILGQDVALNKWQEPFRTLIRSSIGLFGRDTENKSGELAPPQDTEGRKFIDTGYFALVEGEHGRVVKTSLVLNRISQEDFNYNEYKKNPQLEKDSLVKELLMNLDKVQDRSRVVEEDVIINENNDLAVSGNPELQVGQVNELLGLEGLIKYIGRNIGSDFNMGEAVSLGYAAVYDVLNTIGVVGKGNKFASVYSYMYSGKEESLLNTNAIVRAYLSNANIYELGDDDDDEDPDLQDADSSSDGKNVQSIVQSKVEIAYSGDTEEQSEQSKDSTGMSEEELNTIAEAMLQQLIQNYNYKFGSNRGKALELVKEFIRKVGPI